MFPGHPYLRQEMGRAEHQGETMERQRVVRLIDRRMEVLAGQALREKRYLESEDTDEIDPVAMEQRQIKLDFAIETLTELRRAVQQGHQR